MFYARTSKTTFISSVFSLLVFVFISPIIQLRQCLSFRNNPLFRQHHCHPLPGSYDYYCYFNVYTDGKTSTRYSMRLDVGRKENTKNIDNNQNSNNISSIISQQQGPTLSLSATGTAGRSSIPIPINPIGWPLKFPAKQHCSKCGLCETTFVRNVTEACAFLPKLGMNRIDRLEESIHGRARNTSTMVWSKQGTTTNINGDIAEESRFGVLHGPVQLVKGIGMRPKAQWTGVVTSTAIAMLESGQVDAVVCVANNDSSNTLNNNDKSWCTPEPIIAKTVEDILRGRGVKPSLAPSLNILDKIQNDTAITKLLFCGVGCSVQAFRVIQNDLKHIKQVYVLGTNCVDNSPSPEAAENFIRYGIQQSLQEEYNIDNNIRGYEFMQDYRVHVKTSMNNYITQPYFSLPGTIAEQSIAKSCLTCFDYTNALADVVVGYMGAPVGPRMDESYQTITIRNERGAQMVQTAIEAGRLHMGPVAIGSGGAHETIAVATVQADAHVQAMIDPNKIPKNGMPIWLGEIIAFALRSIGPKGINFARYSIDYHILRNYLYILMQEIRVNSSITPQDIIDNNYLPSYAASIVSHYMANEKGFRDLVSQVVEIQKNKGTKNKVK